MAVAEDAEDAEEGMEVVGGEFGELGGGEFDGGVGRGGVGVGEEGEGDVVEGGESGEFEGGDFAAAGFDFGDGGAVHGHEPSDVGLGEAGLEAGQFEAFGEGEAGLLGFRHLAPAVSVR